MLPPVELLAGPGQVAAARLHRIASCSCKVIEGQAAPRVELVIHLRQNLVGVKGTGNIALPSAAGSVGSGDEVVDDLHRHRIETVGTDDALDAVADESLTGGGIDGLGRGGAEIADAFQCGRNDGAAHERAGGLAQSRVGKEEEGPVAFYWTADGSAELVATQRSLGQLGPPVIGV